MLNNELNNKPKQIKRYDVNSLYPFTMKSFPMPVGNPTYFEGDILSVWNSDSRKIQDNKPFGIFEVDIIAPLDIKIPLLQLNKFIFVILYNFLLPFLGCLTFVTLFYLNKRVKGCRIMSKENSSDSRRQEYIL